MSGVRGKVDTDIGKQYRLHNRKIINIIFRAMKRRYEAKEMARIDRKKARGRLKLCNLGTGRFDITAVPNP